MAESIDTHVEQKIDKRDEQKMGSGLERQEKQKTDSVLERISVSKSPQQEEIKPIDDLHVLKFIGRELDLPDSPKPQEMPVIPDQKKAEEDYNSIDYQLIAFNLWKAKSH